MPKTDKRIDAYIAKSADFAHPILNELREIVHEAVPGVEETIKWSMPFFLYRGMLCNFAAFKQHCAFGIWKGAGIVGSDRQEDAMGFLGRITSLKDLPPRKKIIAYVREAAARNEAAEKNPPKPKPKKAAKALKVPPYLAAAIKKNKKAQATWDGFSPSHRNEYVQWVTEAKQEETRNRRIAQTIEWLAEGKSRNWKYANC